MKKIFTTLAVVLMSAVAMNAQLVIGGSLGMGGTAPTVEREDGKLEDMSSASFKMEVNPQVGYMLLDRKLEVGMAIGMGYERAVKSFMVRKNKAYASALGGRSFSLAFAPYAKYDFFEKNGFSFGVKGELALGALFELPNHYFAIKDYVSAETAKELNKNAKEAIKDEPIPFVWGLSIAPVLSYMPTEHVRIEAALTGLGFSVAGSVLSEDGASISSTAANLGLFNGASYIQLGCAYVF